MSAPRSTTTRPRRAARSARGYTFVELLITLAVASLLLTVGIPAFREYSATQRAVALANALLMDVNLARSEALRRPAGVRLVPAGGDWSEGWRVQPSDADEPLAAQTLAAPVALAVTGDPAAVVFDPLGALVTPGGGVEFEICVGAGERFRAARRVVLAPSGHAEVRKPADAGATCA